jgi:hypothetical protein
MEQGGGNSLEEMQRRLAVWDQAGRAPFEDLHEYCQAIGELQWTREIQQTWGPLIRLTLAAYGEEASTEIVRRYQVDAFGRRTGTTCLLELLPLAARNVSTWRFHQWTQLPELKDRATYLERVGTSREIGLRRLIDRHAPRAVVFYSLDYRERWQRIVEAPLTDTGLHSSRTWGATSPRR